MSHTGEETELKCTGLSDNQSVDITNMKCTEIENEKLTLQKVYIDYPLTCFPNRLSNPTGNKSKELKYEIIDINLYEKEANMVAFRIELQRLAPWIRALQILYFETYGNSEDYKIAWYDDPSDWTVKQSGKRSICVDVATPDIPLLYKITLFLNTGVLQVQGSFKDRFVSNDFTKLKTLVEKIVTSNADGSAKQHTISKDQITTHTVDLNSNIVTQNTSTLTTRSTEPYNMQECDLDMPINKALFEVLSRMEHSFTNALEKISTTQTNMFQSKMEALELLHEKNLKKHDEKFTQLLEKFDTLTTKYTEVNKENAEMKSQLGNLKYNIALEKEVLKYEMESKHIKLQEQNNIKDETKMKLNCELEKLSKQMSEQTEKMKLLEVSHSNLQTTLEEREREILSLKMHESRDDSSPFQYVTGKESSRLKPQVTIFGTSNTADIDPQKMSSRYDVTKITAYTLEETEEALKHIDHSPDVILFHSMTNELKSSPPEVVVNKMADLVNLTVHNHPNAKIIISLPTPRADKPILNINAQITALMLKEKYRQESMVFLCDNSNLSYKGEPILKHFNRSDGQHLSESGVKILASNMRDCIDNVLKLPKRNPRYNYSRNSNSYPNRGRGRGQPYFDYRGGRGGRR